MTRYALPALVLLLRVRTTSLTAEPIIPQWCPGVSLPNQLVTALIETESRGHSLALGAVIDDVHLAFYPRTKAAARLLLAELLRRTDNVGIGLMQVNYRWHVKGTGLDPRALLDGATNRRIGLSYSRQCDATIVIDMGRVGHLPQQYPGTSPCLCDHDFTKGSPCAYDGSVTLCGYSYLSRSCSVPKPARQND